MSKTKYPRQLAIEVAQALKPHLEPVTQPNRLMCCGSLRRGKPEVSDLELCFVPMFRVEQSGLFDTAQVDLADRTLTSLLDRGILAKRPNVAGHFAWGPKNKLAIHKPTGLPVDLFSTPEENWFVTVVIRTGPKEFNIQLIGAAARRGLKLHAYGRGFTDARGNVIPVTSEEHLFQLCGMPYLEPSARVA